jgi:hypothetical protein
VTTVPTWYAFLHFAHILTASLWVGSEWALDLMSSSTDTNIVYQTLYGSSSVHVLNLHAHSNTLHALGMYISSILHLFQYSGLCSSTQQLVSQLQHPNALGVRLVHDKVFAAVLDASL